LAKEANILLQILTRGLVILPRLLPIYEREQIALVSHLGIDRQRFFRTDKINVGV
jgi:hypothetical protein